ncbi:pirin family protein [Roseateles sp. BYS87W]|uniref:Pirin family protein n=1 Tax=Pelomonas baiyunensis TaxID=3299026 RepID=A0ABW7GT28_9BURK
MSPAPTAALTRPREVERLVAGQPTSDGAGVRLQRVLTQDLQRRLDPFLMLDHFGSENPDDYVAGFPDHPHRGFETVTYMLHGRIRHRDSAGHEGLVSDGGVQWMTAGRGVIHSELPEQREGRMAGFQLWLNLPAKDKLCPPAYQDVQGPDVPTFEHQGATVRVIAGQSHGVAGAVQRPVTEPLYLDVHLPAGGVFEQPLPATHNAFVYVYEGALAWSNGCRVPAGRMAVLANTAGSDGVRLQAGDAPTRALLVAGQPLGEPIAQYGPFVMNTEAELVQAVRDFQAGRLA